MRVKGTFYSDNCKCNFSLIITSLVIILEAYGIHRLDN